MIKDKKQSGQIKELHVYYPFIIPKILKESRSAWKRHYELLRGKFTRNEFYKYLIIYLSLFSILLIGARITYPPERHYSMATHMISYLGDYTKNPRGWWMFSMACIVMGFGLIPISFYLYDRLIFIRVGVARYFMFSLKGAAISIILIAFFPDAYGETFYYSLFTMNRMHEIIAIIFFSFVFSAEFTFGVIIYQAHFRRKVKRRILPKWPSLVLEGLFIFFFIGLFYTQTTAILAGWEYPYPGIYSLSIWEWSLFLHFLFMTVYMSYHLSKNVPDINLHNRV